MALDQDHGVRATTTATMTTTVLEVAAVPDVGEVCLPFQLRQNDLDADIRQDPVDLVPGEPAAMAHGATGRRSLTGAQHLGQHGGVGAHARLLTGQVGLLDPGALLRRGRHGQVALPAPRQPALEPLL